MTVITYRPVGTGGCVRASDAPSRQSVRPRGLLRLWLWHGTLPGVCTCATTRPPPYQWRRLSARLRALSSAQPDVRPASERQSNTPARLQEPSVRTQPCEAVSEQAMAARSFGAPTWLAEAVTSAWHAPRAVSV